MKDDSLKIGAPKEIARGEARVAVTPAVLSGQCPHDLRGCQGRHG